MHQKMGVRVLQTFRRLANHFASQAHRQAFVVLDQMIEIDAIHELHHQIENALLAIGFVGLHDVGMIQPAREFDFHREAVDVFLIEIAGQDLDGPILFEEFVPGFVDHAHPAASAGFDDLVRTNPHGPAGKIGSTRARGGESAEEARFAEAGTCRGLISQVWPASGFSWRMLTTNSATLEACSGNRKRVFVRSKRIPRLRTVIQLQSQQFLQERAVVVFREFGQIGFDSGGFAGFEQRFEFSANAVDADFQRRPRKMREEGGAFCLFRRRSLRFLREGWTGLVFVRVLPIQGTQFFRPFVANQSHFAFHRAGHAFEFLGDFFVGVTVQLISCHRRQGSSS